MIIICFFFFGPSFPSRTNNVTLENHIYTNINTIEDSEIFLSETEFLSNTDTINRCDRETHL